MAASGRFPLSDTSWDVLVVGGGATGLGVAVQASLEGRRVAVLEARDFACGTSSRSTKLLHGGVRYLAQGQLKLVREALRERAVAMELAPHLAQPLPFIVAEQRWLGWAMTVVGLKAYQWLAGRFSLAATEVVSADELKRRLPSLQGVVAGVRYWDGQFEDARLALALAQTAFAAGACVCNHTRVLAMEPTPGTGWRVQTQDALSGETFELHARCVVNATGVWVDQLRGMALGGPGGAAPRPVVRPSQGVHLVVDRAVLPLTEAVLVPHTADGRVLFAVPWLGAVVIGTTDTPRDDVPLEPRPMREELSFLFDEAKRSLGVALTPQDIKSVWVGLRPLVDTAQGSRGATSRLSREHLILRDAPGFWTVTGGKWTTYRSMAEEVMALITGAGDLPAAKVAAHTASHRLFGAPQDGVSAVSMREAPGPHLLGTQAHRLNGLPGHGIPLGLGLTEAIVRYCARHEYAVTVEDMLARRWRVLFLDAALAERMAPRVAEILQEETGHSPELPAFLALCRQYRLQPEDVPDSGPE